MVYCTSSVLLFFHKKPFIVAAPLCHTLYPPPNPERCAFHLKVSHTHPPASAACLYAPRRMPASASVSRFNCPPHFRPRPASRSLLSPGGSPVVVLSVSHVSHLHTCVLHRLLVFSGSWYLWVSQLMVIKLLRFFYYIYNFNGLRISDIKVFFKLSNLLKWIIFTLKAVFLN